MKLTFFGAAREVTGSRFLLEACGRKLMIDYGMEQGLDLFENTPLPLPACDIDAVLLTHAHIDHSGYLPLLYKQGFRGPIYATAATTDLCRIMLLDSAHIQESEAEWKNRKAARSGSKLTEPLYTQEDALNTHALFKACAYHRDIPIFDGISIRMIDAGHLLGSASIEVTISEEEQIKTVLFSGDIGNLNQPFLRDPEYPEKADYVIMESTYGDRSHGPAPDYIRDLTRILQETFDRGGNVVIPSFAVGRTQEMLYFIRQIKKEGRIHGHDHFPVYVDSPLGIEATHVFNENTYECADEETLTVLKAGVNPLNCDDLRIASSADESQLINTEQTPKVILSSSGMCDAGRIRHHLKHNLWRPECTVLFVGYQSAGTLGRTLADGAKEVKLFGETIAVAAHIETLAGISGHADNAGLMKWISAFAEKPKHVFVVHGDDEVAEGFAKRLHTELGLEANAPYNGESWDLTELRQTADGNRERIERKKAQTSKAADSASEKKAAASSAHISGTYTQLLSLRDRLCGMIDDAGNASEKNQRKLVKALQQLLKKVGRLAKQ